MKKKFDPFSLVNINSIKFKLLLALTSFCLVTTFMILAVFWFNTKEDRLSRVYRVLSKLNVDVKEVSQMEHHFYSFESINGEFYKTNQSGILQKRDALVEDIIASLDVIKHTDEFSPIGVYGKIEIINKEFERFNKAFDSLVVLTKLRGFKDFGLEGLMRRHAHNLEDKALVAGLELNLILQIRRDEKDFFIRKEYKYVEKLREKTKLLQAQIAKMPQKELRTELEQAIREYEKSFLKIVEIEKLLGIHQQNGIKAELDELSSDIERLITEINNKILERTEEVSVQIMVILILVVVIGICLNVGLAYFIVQRLGKPIIHLSNSIHRLIESKFIDYSGIEKINSEDEIGLLAEDIQQMVQELQKTTGELQNRNKELASAYENVKLLSRIGQNISQHIDLKGLMQSIYENLNILMNAEELGVGLYDEQDQLIKFNIFTQNGKVNREFIVDMEDGNRLAVWCLKNRKEVFINDLEKEYQFYVPKQSQILYGDAPQSVMYVPLVAKEKNIGVITVQCYAKNAYTEYHRDLLKGLGAYMASALENANNYQEIANQTATIQHINSDLMYLNAELEQQKEEMAQQTDYLQEINATLEEKNTDLDVKNKKIAMQSRMLEQTVEQLNKQNEQLAETLQKLKSAQSQLIQSEKMASLGQLTAGIAHEINNPINFVYAGIDTLEMSIKNMREVLAIYNELETTEPEKHTALIGKIKRLKKEVDFENIQADIDEMIDHIKHGAERTVEIVKSLRTFSRLDENVMKPSNIHENIESTLVMLRNQYRDNIEIIKDYGDIPLVECMSSQINQALMNILSNAIQAIDKQGTITIRTRLDQNEKIQISLKDTGKGMDEKTQARIFEPFFTTKEVGEGTGLGLAITHGIIDRHNGKIEVRSEIGQGTEFLITLPVEQAKEAFQENYS